MGLIEYCKSLHEQMVREPLPPQRIASGWALGMFVGCFVPFGMQLVVSVPLAIWWRVSKIGATVGTLITNPVTIFFIYPAQCWVGSRLIGSPLSWAYLQGEVFPKLAHASVFSAEGLRVIADLGGRVLGGFFAGGFLLAIVMTPITYFLVLNIVTTFRKARRTRREEFKVQGLKFKDDEEAERTLNLKPETLNRVDARGTNGDLA